MEPGESDPGPRSVPAAAGSSPRSRARSRRMGVKSLRYFGEKLVAFRGEDGKVHVLDAYCAHMGADLGGGREVDRQRDRVPVPRVALLRHAANASRSRTRRRSPEGAAARVDGTRGQRRRAHAPRSRWQRRPTSRSPSSPSTAPQRGLPWVTSHYAIKTHPREIVENLADRGALPARPQHRIDDFELRRVGAHGHAKGERARRSCRAAGSTTSPRRRRTTAPAISSCA